MQVRGVHGPRPHTPGIPAPPQVNGGVQLPHSITLPQPSPAGPQWRPWSAQVCGWHAGEPQAPAVPLPPQVVPAGHIPQSSVPPQPSPAGPHESP